MAGKLIRDLAKRLAEDEATITSWAVSEFDDGDDDDGVRVTITYLLNGAQASWIHCIQEGG